MSTGDIPFEEDEARAAPDGAAFVVDVDGFEGPLDLLLALARTQKVDLTKISILALVEQYTAFVEEARRVRLELAADYLVMAAWLAYLKSRLLLPPEPKSSDEPSGEEMAALLALRLKRLEAMREAGARLMTRSRLGRDVFARGAPEPVAVTSRTRWQASLYDLLTAYATQRQRQMVTEVHVARRKVWSLADARFLLTRMIGDLADWVPVETLLAPFLASPEMRASVRASAFTASLELAREGHLDLRQSEAFAPIYLRARPATPDVRPPEDGDGR